MTRHMLSEEADRLARQMAEQTGDTLDEVVMRGLRAEAERTSENLTETVAVGENDSETWEERLAAIRAIQRRVAALPRLEEGSDEELLYDADGLPK
jgi:antitoxin VapB